MRKSPRSASVLACVALAAAGLLSGCASPDGYALVGIDEWHADLMAAEEPYLLDVRTVEEHEEGHIPGALHIPYQEIEDRLDELPEAKDEPIWLYCRTDRRSQIAAAHLSELGYSDLRVLEGGILAWQEAGHEVAR